MKRILTVLVVFCSLVATAAEHPILLLTKEGVKEMRAAMGTVPQFDASVEALFAEADAAVAKDICIPEPKDGGGGYSHEAHKLNYYDMYACGVAYQLSGDKKYAQRVRDILYAYAEMYPTLGYHPLGLSSTPGRIFWQTLNESVWLVHTSVAYDCIYDFLPAKDRKFIEGNLFRPMADFIMNGTPELTRNREFFNRMHNHATWGTAGVGMIGMVMGDQELIDKALYGTDRTGRNGGFIMQLDKLFSPDGYFTEGAYYQRYAIWPFVTFAQCIENYDPSLRIFEYRDGIILKAVDTLIQMAYDGEFLRFNDALEKGYDAQELISAVDIAYYADQSNKQLLTVAKDYQRKVLVSDAGFAVAKGIDNGEAKKIEFKSCFLKDGAEGDNGGIAILRPARQDLNSVLSFKATSHGLGHGHFDKLTFAYYDNGNEIITDYGAARFINIDAKYYGHYTKVNKSYATQTVAHNTLAVDEGSHFNGQIKEASKHWPSIYYTNVGKQRVQYVSAIEENAVPGVRMHRTMAYAEIPFLEYPVILDILKAESSETHCYDYPIHYNGHMMSLNVPYEKNLESMPVLGKQNGYQHLWVEAQAKGGDSVSSYTWLTGSRMYSLSLATDSDTEIYLARTGANDPDFELRSEQMIMFREKAAANHTFAACLETHGRYDLQLEQSANLERSCTDVKVVYDDENYVVADYCFAGGNSLRFCISLRNADEEARHCVTLADGQPVYWDGPMTVIVNKDVPARTNGTYQYADQIRWEYADPGITRQIMAYDDDIMIVKVKFEKGAVGSEHKHFHTQATFVESGRFKLNIGGETAILEAGDGYYVAPDELHGCVCLEPGVLIDVFTPQRADFLKKPKGTPSESLRNTLVGGSRKNNGSYQYEDKLEWENAEPGVTRQIMAYDDNIMIVKVKFEKGAVGNVHKHPHTQATFVESGRFELNIGGETAVLEGGDGYYVTPDALHGCRNLEAGVLIDVFTPQRADFLKKK